MELLLLALVARILTHLTQRRLAPLKIALTFVVIIGCTVLITSYWRWIPSTLMFVAFSFVAWAILSVVAFGFRHTTLFTFFFYFCILAVVVPIISIFYDDWQTVHTKEYCSTLTGYLEQFKDSHGTYPEQLVEIGSLPDKKPLTISLNGEDESCGYYRRSFDGNYSFFVSEGFLSGWSYDSEEASWAYID